MGAHGKVLGVGIIGCGAAAQALHLPALASLADRFRVRHLTDASSAVAATLADRLGARASTLASDLLDDPAVDVVLITAPDRYHARLAVDACRAGKAAVLVEKPLALWPGEARAVADTSEATGVPVMVGTMHRHDPAFEWVRQHIPESPDAVLIESVFGANPDFRDDVVSFVSGPPDRVDAELPFTFLGSGIGIAGVEAEPGFLMAAALSTALSAHDLVLLRATLGEPTAIEHAGWMPNGWQATFAYGATKASLFVYESRIRRVQWRARWFSPDRIVELTFPQSWEPGGAAVAEVHTAADGALHTERFSARHETGFRREWEHLYRVVTDGEPLVASAADAAADVELAARAIAFGARRPEPSPDQVGVALVGAGWITGIHGPTLAGMSDAHIPIVLSRSERSAEWRSWGLGAEHATFADLHEAIGRSDVDVALVAGPPATHAEHVLEALDQGKVALVEKPLATTLVDADRIVERGGDRVGYLENYAFVPAIAEARRIIASGDLGEIDSIQVWTRNSRPAWGDFLDVEWGGGALFDLGAHTVWWAMALAGFADPTEVHADLTRDPEGRSDVHGAVDLSFSNGISAAIEVSWDEEPGRERSGARVVGSIGALDLVLDPHATITVDRGGMIEKLPIPFPERPLIGAWLRKHGYIQQLESMVGSIRAGKPLEPDAAMGRAVLDVICGAYRSAGTGRVEPLPFSGARDRTPLELWQQGAAEQ